TSSMVPSVDWSSQKIISVSLPSCGMRRTAASTFPFSSLQGMITETDSSSLENGGGSSLATTTCVMQSLFKKGRRAQKRFKKADSNGTHLGNSTIRCVSSASKPASFIRFRMSAMESQFCSTRGTFMPVHSANVTNGSQKWL